MNKIFRKTACFLILVLMFTNLFTISTIGASAKIASIKNLSITLKLNEKYTLPKTVSAAMSDKTTKSVPVVWDKKTLDTSKAGNYTFKGKVQEYKPEIILIVKVINPNLSAKKEEVEPKPEAEISNDKWTLRSDLPSINEPKLSSIVYSGYSHITFNEYNYDVKKAVTCGNNIIFIHNDGKVKEYDPVKDIWTDKYQISELQNSNGDFKLVSIDNMIYIIGVNFTDVLVYDPATNKCSLKTKLPTKRRVGGVVSANNKIYILGGFDATIGRTINTLEEYDPKTDKWTKKADMTGRGSNSVTVAALDDQIYILNSSGEKEVLEAYDIKNNSWTVKTPTGDTMYSTRNLEAANGRLYAIVSYKKDDWNIWIQEYNPKTNKCISRTGTSTERGSFASVVLNEEIYLIGGINFKPEPEGMAELQKYYENLRTNPSSVIENVKTVEKYTPSKP